ncbi:MAG: hypothetical protein ABUL63_01175 [Acidobacteriota bacterium]
MATLASDIALRAAARLADLNPSLPGLTERAVLRDEEPEGAPRRMRGMDPGTGIAVASLLVSMAQIGWQIYRDLKADRAERQRTVETLVSRLRPSLTGPAELTLEQRDRLLRVLAEEIAATQPAD